MKVTVTCERCNSKVELTPETRGNISYISQPLRDNQFRIFECDIETDVSSYTDTEFVLKLVSATTKEKVEEILSDDISYNVEVDKKLRSVRIDCQNCGEYIVLEGFDQF